MESDPSGHLIARAIAAWIVLLLLCAMFFHACRANADEQQWQLVVIDHKNRLHQGEIYQTRGECLLDAGAYKGQSGILWAACVVAEVGV